MKLRLNKSLRAAVLACCVAALSLTTANADFVWNGGDTISAADWNNADNWTLTDGTTYPTGGDGPATPYSDAWGNIVIRDASTTETINLEGWSVKLDVSGNSNVVVSTKKMQGGSTAITVHTGSTLTLNWGAITGFSNDEHGDTVTLDGGTMNVVLYRNVNDPEYSGSGGATTVNFGTLNDSSTLSSFNISSDAAGTAHTFNNLTFTAVLNASATSAETTLHYIDLGSYTSDITINNFSSNITAANFSNAGNTALTATDANIGKYSVVREDGNIRLYYVTGTISDFTWNGTEENHVWNAGNTNWLAGGTAAAYNPAGNLIFAAHEEGVSATVTMNGGDYAARSIELQDAYTLDVTVDSTLSAESITGDGSFTKAGEAKLTTTSANAAKIAAIEAGTLAISDRLTGGTFGSGMTVGEEGTLEVTCIGDGQGTQLVLADASNGTVNIMGGKLRVDSQGATNLGDAKLVLAGGTTLNFANSERTRTSQLSNDIEASGDITLQTWGDASTTANNILSGTITGTANFTKTDGGTLNITGNVAANSIKANAGVLNITGNVTADNSIMGNGGALNIAGTVVANQLFVARGTTEITGGTTTVSQVRLSENGANGNKLVISGGTLTITGTNVNHGTDASLLLAHWGQTGFLEVNGGTLDAAGTQALMSWTGVGTLSVNSGTAKLMGVNFWGQSYSGTDFKGTFNLGTAEDGDGVLELGSSGFVNVGSAGGGTAYVNLGNGTIKAMADTGMDRNTGYGTGTVRLIGTAGGTKFDTNGHNFNVNNLNVSGGGNLVKAGEGTLTFNGTLEAGAITIEEGTLQLNGATTIGQAITNDGTLSFGTNGKLVIADLDTWTPAGAATYTDTQAPESGNGYLNISYEVVKGSGTVSGTATVTVNNEDKTLESGMLVYAGNGGTYYVNSGDVVYAEGNTVASEATTGITLNGGSLTVQKELSHGMTLAQDATVTIADDGIVNKSSVTTDGHALTIAGSGTYDIGNSIALGATLDSGWTGTVALSGVTFNASTQIGNLSNLGNANSTVQLSASTGSVNGSQYSTTTVSSNLELVNGGTDNVALKITDGYSHNKLQVTGKVTGSGYIKAAATTRVDDLKYEFTGDVSQWDGGFTMADDYSGAKTFSLIFSGTSDVKAKISSTSDTLNVTFGGDAAGEVTGKTISSVISQDGGTVNLVLSGSLTKTFTSDVTVNSTTIAGGDLIIANGATFTSGGESIASNDKENAATISGTGTVSVATSTLTYNNAYIQADSDVTIAATLNNSTVKTAGGDATMGAGSVTATTDLVADNGAITISGESATAKSLTVAADQEVAVANEGETGSLTVATANVAGYVDAKLTVTGSFEAKAGAAVTELTISSSGTLTLNAVQSDALTVGNDDFTVDYGQISFSDALKAAVQTELTGLTVDKTVVLLNNALGSINVTSALTDSDAIAAAFGLTGLLPEGATLSLGNIPSASGMMSLDGTTDSWGLLVSVPTSLTVTEVTGAASFEGGVLTLTTNADPAGDVLTGPVNLTVGSAAWDQILGLVGDPHQYVTIAFADFDTNGNTVTLNDYAGEADGTHFVAFIPEPTTGALSVLALAALAMRRRRKAA